MSRYKEENNLLAQMQDWLNKGHAPDDVVEPGRGETWLHTAARLGYPRAVRRMIAAGASPNVADKKGCTPLECAITGSAPDDALELSVAMLLAGRADTVASSPAAAEESLLVEAADRRRPLVIEMLLQARGGPPAEEKYPGEIQSALERSLGRLPLEELAGITRRFLEAQGPKPLEARRIGEEGNTRMGTVALHDLAQNVTGSVRAPSFSPSAAQVESVEDTVRLLARHGVDPDLRSRKGATPLIQAASGADNQVCQALVRSLLHAKADPNRGNRVHTPLICAAQFGNERIVRILLLQGAEVNQANSMGHTALHAAAKFRHADVVWTLLEHGADPALQDGVGNVPLHYAAQPDRQRQDRTLPRRWLNCVQMLCTPKEQRQFSVEFPDGNTENLKGETPLGLALANPPSNSDEPQFVQAHERLLDLLRGCLSTGPVAAAAKKKAAAGELEASP